MVSWALRTVLGGLRVVSTAGQVAHASQALGMPAGQAPGPMAFMLAAELLSRRRMVAGRAAITHSGQFGGGE